MIIAQQNSGNLQNNENLPLSPPEFLMSRGLKKGHPNFIKMIHFSNIQLLKLALFFGIKLAVSFLFFGENEH